MPLMSHQPHPGEPQHNHPPGTVCGESCPVLVAQQQDLPARSNPRGATRVSQGGRLVADPRWPRQNIVGDPGMQVELATNPERTHGVITVLGGSSMAACGFPPDLLRDHAQACLKLADDIERIHGRQESGRL